MHANSRTIFIIHFAVLQLNKVADLQFFFLALIN